jgi:hypothetical protein
MKILALTLLVFISSKSYAGFGANLGLGAPYISQIGLNYTHGASWTLNLHHNSLSISTGEAEADLTMPELSLNWHPFQGSFFVGFGVGKQKLAVSATDQATSVKVTADVDSSTTMAKLGWMWGKADGGFWFGFDIAYIMPSGGKVTIDAPGVSPTSQEYQDVEKAGEKFAETSYVNITFARLGYLF